MGLLYLNKTFIIRKALFGSHSAIYLLDVSGYFLSVVLFWADTLLCNYQSCFLLKKEQLVLEVIRLMGNSIL